MLSLQGCPGFEGRIPTQSFLKQDTSQCDPSKVTSRGLSTDMFIPLSCCLGTTCHYSISFFACERSLSLSLSLPSFLTACKGPVDHSSYQWNVCRVWGRNKNQTPLEGRESMDCTFPTNQDKPNNDLIGREEHKMSQFACVCIHTCWEIKTSFVCHRVFVSIYSQVLFFF